MSPLLAEVHAKGGALDAAEEHRDEALSAARQQRQLADRLSARVGEVRQALVDQRVAITVGQVPEADLSATDVLSSEIDAEAGSTLAGQLDAAATAAQDALNAAREAMDDAIYAYAQEVETEAICEANEALKALSEACAKAIAAADVSRRHDKSRSHINLPLNRWYGSAGYLVDQLRQVDWMPPIDLTDFKRQWVNEKVTTHPGVDEALAGIEAIIEGEGDR